MKWLLVCWKEEKETRSDPFLRPRPTHVHSLVTLVHSVSETVGNTRGMGMVWIVFKGRSVSDLLQRLNPFLQSTPFRYIDRSL